MNFFRGVFGNDWLLAGALLLGFLVVVNDDFGDFRKEKVSNLLLRCGVWGIVTSQCPSAASGDS